MKKLIINYLLLTTITLLFTQISFGNNKSSSDNENTISITLLNKKANLNISGKGELIIDWGDGNIEKYNDTLYSKNISHTYTNLATYTIKITGENILILACIDNQITNLDISKSTSLVQLYCSSNNLTNLDISQNTALTVIYFYNNQLTSLDSSNNTALTDLSCAKTNLQTKH